LRSVRPAVAKLAETLELPVENLLTPDYLRQVAFTPPEVINADSIAQQLFEIGARKWQVELVAEVIATVLNEPPSLESETESETEDND
jgi:ribonuclease D